MQKNISANALNLLTIITLYRIKKRLFIYKKYARNQIYRDFNILADYTQVNNLIRYAMNLNFFR